MRRLYILNVYVIFLFVCLGSRVLICQEEEEGDDDVKEKLEKHDYVACQDDFAKKVFGLSGSQVKVLCDMIKSDRNSPVLPGMHDNAHVDETRFNTGITVIDDGEEEPLSSIPTCNSQFDAYLQDSKITTYLQPASMHTADEEAVIKKIGKVFLKVCGSKAMILRFIGYVDAQANREELSFHQDRDRFGGHTSPDILAFVVLDRKSTCVQHKEGDHPIVYQQLGLVDQSYLPPLHGFVVSYAAVDIIEQLIDKEGAGYLVRQIGSKKSTRIVHSRTARKCGARRVSLVIRGVSLDNKDYDSLRVGDLEQCQKDEVWKAMKATYLSDPKIAKALYRINVLKNNGEISSMSGVSEVKRIMDRVGTDNNIKSDDVIYNLKPDVDVTKLNLESFKEGDLFRDADGYLYGVQNRYCHGRDQKLRLLKMRSVYWKEP